MKKLVLIAAALLFSFNMAAQLEDEPNFGWVKGDGYFSGSVGFSTSKQADFKSNSLNLMPSAGFLVTDNFAVGAQLGFMTNKNEFEGNTTGEVNTFMAGAYGKWLCKPEKQLTPYLAVGFNYVTENDKINEIKYNGFEIGAGAGLLYSLDEDWFIGANYSVASYATLKGDFDGAEATNTFNIGLDWKQLSFALGRRF